MLPSKASPVLSGHRCGWQQCGKPLVRKPEEKAANFAKRKTCSRECAALLRGTTAWRNFVGRGSGLKPKPVAPDVWEKALVGLTYEDDPRAAADFGWPPLPRQLRPHGEWERVI